MPGDRASMQSPVGDQSWPSGHSSCSLYFGTFATLFTIWIVYVRRMVRALAYTCGVRMIVDRHRNSMVACMHAGDTLQDGSWSVEVTNGRDAHRGLLRLVLLAFDARGMDCQWLVCNAVGLSTIVTRRRTSSPALSWACASPACSLSGC
eukprot:TRINITY_DN11409_c0_g2_i5.p2 TRINITY_DN11409_c0_g2~~TRINITY_DN11409_c0_g2_i5.p2  ORF type:complete len:149 (-),score=3.47 TRINITY_DN11409_c0_g2_i5:2731-3177(-)